MVVGCALQGVLRRPAEPPTSDEMAGWHRVDLLAGKEVVRSGALPDWLEGGFLQAIDGVGEPWTGVKGE